MGDEDLGMESGSRKCLEYSVQICWFCAFDNYQKLSIDSCCWLSIFGVILKKILVDFIMPIPRQSVEACAEFNHLNPSVAWPLVVALQIAENKLKQLPDWVISTLLKEHHSIAGLAVQHNHSDSPIHRKSDWLRQTYMATFWRGVGKGGGCSKFCPQRVEHPSYATETDYQFTKLYTWLCQNM